MSLFLGLCLTLQAHAAQSSSPGTADYGYFDGTADRQRVVIIGANLAKDVTKTNYCQTRTRSGDTTSDWHDAVEIVRAEEDQ